MIGFVGQIQAAAPGITAATGGGAISLDTCNVSWTSLLGPVLTEAAAGDITTGGTDTIVINAPANMEFNTEQEVTALVSGGGTKLTLSDYTVSPTASTITFEVSTISVASPSTITFLNIQVRPKTGSCTTISTANMTFSGTSSATGNCGALTTTFGVATKLAFTGQPSTPTVASVAFTTQPIVTIQDMNGNTRTADTNEITIAAYSNVGCTTVATGTLSGTLAMNAIDGEADFVGLGLKYNKVGTIYLRASTPGLTSACSNAEVINVGAASKVIVSAYPTVGYTYSNFSTQPVVQITDADDNVVTTDNSRISIEAYTKTNFDGTKSEFNGTSTIYATDDGLVGGAATGIATFAGIKYNTVNTTGIFLCAWVDANGDGVKDEGETKTGCSPLFKVYANSSNAPVAQTTTVTTAPTTTTTSAATTTTTLAPATSVPTTVKPVSSMTEAEKTTYLGELKTFLVSLLTQILNALLAAQH